MWKQYEQETRVFIPAYTQGLTPEAIRKGYKNTGIYPLNPQAEKLKNIQASAVYDRCKCMLGLLGGVRVIVFIRRFKFTLKPPYSITHGKL